MEIVSSQFKDSLLLVCRVQDHWAAGEPEERGSRHPEEGGGDGRRDGWGGAGVPAVPPSLHLLLLPLLHSRHPQPGGLYLETLVALFGISDGGLHLEFSCVLCSVQVHFLYQFSLKFFLEIFQVVLSQNPNLKGITDYSQRLHTITTDMFQVYMWGTLL